MNAYRWAVHLRALLGLQIFIGIAQKLKTGG